MKKKKKKNSRTLRESLPDDLAKSVLQMTVPIRGDDGTIWVLLEEARRAQAEAVEIANKALRGNPVAGIVAEHAMKKLGKRGFAHIEVDPNGTVMLVVNYDAPQVAPVGPSVEMRTALPPISALRQEAEDCALDWKPFGKNKTALLAALTAVKVRPVPVAPVSVDRPAVIVTDVVTPPLAPQPARAPVPVAVPPSPVAPKPVSAKVIAPDTRKVLPDDDDGLSDLFKGVPAKTIMAPVAPDTTPVPLKRPATVTLPPVTPKTFGGRTLSALAAKADSEVDIEAILAKPPAAAPPSDDSPD